MPEDKLRKEAKRIVKEEPNYPIKFTCEFTLDDLSKYSKEEFIYLYLSAKKIKAFDRLVILLAEANTGYTCLLKQITEAHHGKGKK